MKTKPYEISSEELFLDLLQDAHGVLRMETFEEAGVLTSEEGLVVTFEDGSEYQITIVKSKGAK